MIIWSSTTVCMDTRPCFAKSGRTQICNILTKAPAKDGACSFCKPEQEVTDGVSYAKPKKKQDRKWGEPEFDY